MSDPPQYILEGLEKQSPETLREIAQIATEMAEKKERQLEAELEDEKVADRPKDLDRDDAPISATLTTKKINGNQYYYWQWREGEKIKSEYIRPVDAK
ncbi:hypothetical protein C491_15412 [Natronococcus amylolyticus DSM 10524]|uniref:DUF6788 domain-containing protein n=1 Tax=Natronococcus amylolyticus DSM 10524 TaxID=1227497 RepID=L9X1I6_9EURY|nr:hypothetical protein [Natronococcus amylolyticus]ELY55575.1 hypothetical protein C491_15412 [Natronococcus amylolyticus DSM 10524]